MKESKKYLLIGMAISVSPHSIFFSQDIVKTTTEQTKYKQLKLDLDSSLTFVKLNSFWVFSLQ
jgi:hypothetical protein